MTDTVVKAKEGATAPSVNAADIVTLNRDDLAKLLQSAADQAVAKLRASDQTGGSPKIMQAKVSDGFIKSERNVEGPVLKRYRVDGVRATKIVELDMERLRYYEENRDELPMDREGFPYSPRTMANKKGKFINILEGKVAARSQNQIEQLEWMKTQPEDQGGLPGLYEVTEETQLWLCTTCKPSRPFNNKIDWEAHREATHQIPRERAA